MMQSLLSRCSFCARQADLILIKVIHEATHDSTLPTTVSSVGTHKPAKAYRAVVCKSSFHIVRASVSSKIIMLHI